jgi:hypothetical protein
MADLEERVRSLLSREPGLTNHDIRSRLAHDGGTRLTRYELNSHLYGHRKLYRHDGPTGTLPRWFLVDATPPVSRTPQAASGLVLPQGLNLYGWQHRALTAWQRAGFRGVIEAVTGAGKTRVAMAAVAMQLAAKGRVAVLVHT